MNTDKKQMTDYEFIQTDEFQDALRRIGMPFFSPKMGTDDAFALMKNMRDALIAHAKKATGYPTFFSVRVWHGETVTVDIYNYRSTYAEAEEEGASCEAEALSKLVLRLIPEDKE